MPVKPSERYVILDMLRGLALLGIALANFPEFSLYSFLSAETADAMPTSGIDRVVQVLFSSVWLHYCQFGPLEWGWRMLTYGKVFKLVKERNG